LGCHRGAWLAADRKINTGEAGIDARLYAVNRRFPECEMFISSRLTDSEYAAGRVLGNCAGPPANEVR